jgi:hypothetical protein
MVVNILMRKVALVLVSSSDRVCTGLSASKIGTLGFTLRTNTWVGATVVLIVWGNIGYTTCC